MSVPARVVAVRAAKRIVAARGWLPRYSISLGIYAWRWQKRRLSTWVITVVAVGAVLSVASAVQLIVLLAGTGISNQLHSASEIQVFLIDSASQDQQATLKGKLAQVSGIGHITYRSKADAQARAAHDPQLAALSSAGDGNPFPASLVLQMSDPAVARQVLKVAAGDPAVDPKIPASYTATQAQQLSSALAAIQTVAWVVDGVALALGALVALSLLRSEIRARHEELRMLALVGVPSVAVRLPLVIQVLSVGLAASLLAVLSLNYVGHSVVPALDHSLPFLHLGDPTRMLAGVSLATVAATSLALLPCALLVRLPR
jgi:cell division protein FtsX